MLRIHPTPGTSSHKAPIKISRRAKGDCSGNRNDVLSDNGADRSMAVGSAITVGGSCTDGLDLGAGIANKMDVAGKMDRRKFFEHEVFDVLGRAATRTCANQWKPDGAEPLVVGNAHGTAN